MSQAEIDAGRKLLQKNAMPAMEQVMRDIQEHRYVVDGDRWVAFLEFIERDLGPKIMRDINASEPKAEDFEDRPSFSAAHQGWERSKREMWSRFESFSEGRAAGHLDSPQYGSVFMAIAFAGSAVTDKLRTFFRVTDRPKVEISG
jgi:hypothetical protein